MRLGVNLQSLKIDRLQLTPLLPCWMTINLENFCHPTWPPESSSYGFLGNVHHMGVGIKCPPNLQGGKTHCPAFCASLALLAGSGYNASCNGSQWLGGAADCYKVREVRCCSLIYLYLGKHEFFSTFYY